MLEMLTIVVVVSFIIHMLILIIRGIRKNNVYNQTIFLSGGRYGGVHQGAQYRIVDENIEANDTLVSEKNSVTSSFSGIYIRLYQLYTGKCYDAYLQNMLRIGRAGIAENAAVLYLDDPMVSKKHCMLFRRGDQILIQDLESTNHTYVNGCKIQGAVPITHGDQISLGNSKYQFQCYYQR